MNSIALKLSDVSKKSPACGSILSACMDPQHTILCNINCDRLLTKLTNAIKSKSGLLSFLFSLLDEPDDRYIKLPHYNNITKRKLKDNELYVDDNGKYGILLNIVSNKKTFNFSVRLKDMTIIKYNELLQKQERGSFRSFTLTDKYGNIGENWKVLKVFQMHETKKIFDNHDKHDKQNFDCFIDDSIGDELLSIYYFVLKCYINRLVRERDYWLNLKEKATERDMNGDWEFEKQRLKDEGVL